MITPSRTLGHCFYPSPIPLPAVQLSEPPTRHHAPSVAHAFRRLSNPATYNVDVATTCIEYRVCKRKIVA